jgi:OFA family oxalate/formate antiporter-like MFS transporter
MPAHAESLGRVEHDVKLKRWVQLIIGVICMVMIANLQYGWTLFATPLGAKYHWTRDAVRVSFTIFVAAETWLVPIEGYLVDRFGPRLVTISGGVLIAIGWSMNSVADSLPMLYVAQAIGGIGAGAVYGTCVGAALKWFPDRRGLAAGITAAGFGAGSAATVIPIASMIKSAGYEATFLYFGLGQGLVVFVLGWLLRRPDASELAALPQPKVKLDRRSGAPRNPQAVVQRTPTEMLRTRAFWVMYLMFVLMATGGLFVTGNLKQVAEDYKVSDVEVSFLWWSPTAATFALSLDRVLNGVTRPFFGWVSDRLGRENTMFIAFFTEAVGIVLLSRLGHNPILFVALSAVVFFGWGEIYSLFPSTCADTYGSKYASANAGLLYTAKGSSALLLLLVGKLQTATSWETAFALFAAMNLAAAILALAVLKPMRRRMREREAQ